MAPLRDLKLVTRCRVCKQPAETSCLRCQAPLCSEHRPVGERRCDKCELFFREQMASLPVLATPNPGKTLKEHYVAAAITGTLGGLLGIAIGLVFWSLSAVILAGGGLAILFFLLGGLITSWRWVLEAGAVGRWLATNARRKARRREFLRERPTALLSESTD